MKDLVKQPIVWVDDDAQLEQLCLQWQECKLLAVDTEFMRSQTYYPIAGLIQVNNGDSSFLIDPLEISDFYPLVDILDNENIIKAIHSSSEDIDVFYQTLGCAPKNMLDTQIAAALSGYGFSLGFANLVRAAMNIDLPKSETRSDWLARPLSQAQIYYAAMDVEYLYSMTELLVAQLQHKQRLDWAFEESNTQIDRYFAAQDSTQTYLRFKSAWRLNTRQLGVLQALSSWREHMAQEKNIPRNRILKDQTIYELSKSMPSQLSKLKSYEGITERMVRNNGEEILAIIEKITLLPEDSLPEILPRPLSGSEKDDIKKLKDHINLISQETGIPSELLVKKKDYEMIARTKIPDTMNGWRWSLLSSPIEAFIATK